MPTTRGRLALAIASWCGAAVSLAAQSPAADRYQPLAQMHHTTWTAGDGLVGQPNALAQTLDGFLWIGTSDGLYRFDGVAFELFRPASGALHAVAVSTLRATPDGSLWVGHSRGGISVIAPDGSVRQYTVADGLPVSRIRSIAMDQTGAVWVAAVGGLARLADGEWKIVRMDWNYPCKSAWKVEVEPDGTLWVSAATPNKLFYLPRGSTRFVDTGYRDAAIDLTVVAPGIVALSPYEESTTEFWRRTADGATRFLTIENLPAQGLALDRDGGLWLAGFGASRTRLTFGSNGDLTRGPVEHYGRDDGLSGDVASAMLVDREGTVWVTTEVGLDRFRRRKLAWTRDTSVRAGANFATGPDGRVWFLTYLPPGMRDAATLEPVPGVSAPVDNASADQNGNLWIATTNAFLKWSGGRVEKIPPPDAVTRLDENFDVLASAADTAGRIWASIGGFGVQVWDGREWTFKEIFPDRPDLAPMTIRPDSSGNIWLVYRDEVAVVHGDSLRVYTRPDGLDFGPHLTLRTVGDRVWVGGERGLGLLDGSRFRIVKPADGSALGLVSTITPTSDGLWLTASGGIVHLPRTEVDRIVSDSQYRAQFDLLSVGGDLPDPVQAASGGRALEWAAAGNDGRLWFATTHGFAIVDPARIIRNTIPPPVLIRSVMADDSMLLARDGLTIPPRTRNLRIAYTALSMVDPSRMQFRHRLEGWDDEWHEAGSRREVFYTDLNPGRYTLTVLASNNDGVWNETGASLSFTVAPAWYQAAWFHALVAAGLLAIVIAMWQYRLRRMARELSARFDVRLEERTRIARDLHDTLLQTVQGSKMVAEDALEHAGDPERTRHALERLARWLGQASSEGRAALNSLRTPTTSVNDLADSLRNAARTAARPDTLDFSVEVKGAPRDLHPVAGEEIYRIGYEAMQNVFSHASATRLKVVLEYDQDLILRVHDNGKGIEPGVAGNGKSGRYGLRGMRERAAAIGATLTFSPGQPGTEVILIVPGRTAFRASTPPQGPRL